MCIELGHGCPRRSRNTPDSILSCAVVTHRRLRPQKRPSQASAPAARPTILAEQVHHLQALAHVRFERRHDHRNDHDDPHSGLAYDGGRAYPHNEPVPSDAQRRQRRRRRQRWRRWQRWRRRRRWRRRWRRAGGVCMESHSLRGRYGRERDTCVRSGDALYLDRAVRT